MDFKSQLESIPTRLHGKFRNVSCVMQELGYLDGNYEPNYVKISERISNLPVSEELRRDMQDGVTFCQQFSVSFDKSTYYAYVIYVVLIMGMYGMGQVLLNTGNE